MIGYLWDSVTSGQRNPTSWWIPSWWGKQREQDFVSFKCFSWEFCSQNYQRRTKRMHLLNHTPWERCFGCATDRFGKSTIHQLIPKALFHMGCTANARSKTTIAVVGPLDSIWKQQVASIEKWICNQLKYVQFCTVFCLWIHFNFYYFNFESHFQFWISFVGQ